MRIKICGINSDEEVLFLNKLKPDYVGLVFADSKRKVSISDAERLLSKLSKDIKVVAVFKNNSFEFISEVLEKLLINIVQLHGFESNEFISEIRERYKLQVWKGISVKSRDSVKHLDDCNADLILLDGSKAGSGERFPWRYLKDLKSNKQIFLAGGINEGNIKEALNIEGISGIDISSGVESTVNGVCKKDELKVKTIIEKVRKSNER